LLRHENKNGGDFGPDQPTVAVLRNRKVNLGPPWTNDMWPFLDTAIDWNNNYVGRAIGESDSSNLFTSMVTNVVTKCGAALLDGRLDLRVRP
jgi:hypothetical protein